MDRSQNLKILILSGVTAAISGLLYKEVPRGTFLALNGRNFGVNAHLAVNPTPHHRLKGPKPEGSTILVFFSRIVLHRAQLGGLNGTRCTCRFKGGHPEENAILAKNVSEFTGKPNFDPFSPTKAPGGTRCINIIL
jgi:hypothetical protein